MEKILFGSLLLLSLTTTFTATAQQDNPLIVSGNLLQQGITLHDSGAYSKAIAVFSAIDRNDTNYVRALYNIGLAYYADSQYTKSTLYSQQALRLHDDREMEPELYNHYGNSLNATNDDQRALEVFDSAIAKYPAYSLLYLNKAAVLMKLHRYPEAERILQHTLVMDPYSYSSHFKLGLCAINEGKLIQAIFCLAGYLLMTPEGRYHSNCLSLLNAISHNTDEIQKLVNDRKEATSDNYQLLEQIVQSKIALDKSYKPIIQLDDPISRQIQVIFEKMEYDAADSDFYTQYYMPFFKACYSGDQFEVFINHIFLSATNIPIIQEYNKKHKKELADLTDKVVAYFSLIRRTRELNYSKRDSSSSPIWSVSNGERGHGKRTKEDQEVGPWEYYYSAGNIKAKGLFNDQGKKEGAWTYYYFDGTVKGKEIYQDGKQIGEETYYFSNGSISSHSWYKDGAPDGESISYFLVGTPKAITHYRAGKEDGIKTGFFDNGDTSFTETYSAGVLNGPAKTWHQNRKIENIYQYVNGKLEGPYEKYYDNGQLSTKGNYSLDKLEGIWNYYYPNGQLKVAQNFIHDQQEGEHKEFYDNGVIKNDYLIKHGKIQGDSRNYDDDGKLASIFHYENDILQRTQYFDKTGASLGQVQRDHKLLQLTTYMPDGTKTSQATYNEKGDVTGTKTFYLPSGALDETDEFVDGNLQGPVVSYYPDGTKKLENNYTGGKLDGAHKYYYSDGRLSNQGWYQNDDACGYWLYYNHLGALTDSVYYKGGSISGFKETYQANGKKEYETRYRSGWLQQWVQFDSTGRVLQNMNFQDGTGKVHLVYPDGKIWIEGRYIRGKLDGPYTTWYPDGKKLAGEYYKKGLQDSSYKAYYHSGQVSTDGHYSYDNKSGRWNYYYPDGKLKSTEEYMDGKLNGKQTYYFENGKVEEETTYKNGDKTGPFSQFDPDGTLLYELIWKEDRLISYTWLDKNGVKKPATPVVAESAKIKTWFPNGNVAAEIEYKDGFLDGQYKLYFTNGRLRFADSLKYGDIEGRYVVYYDNGQIKDDYLYLHSNMNGPYTEYNEKGVLTEKGYFYDGSAHGVTELYDDNGHSKEKDFYYYGNLLSIK